MRLTILFLSLFLSLGALLHAKTKKLKIRGYITNVVSATNFEIEDYKINRDKNLVLSVEKAEKGEAASFSSDDIRVGTLVVVEGTYNEETGELKAESIKVNLEENRKLKRTALIEQAPRLEHGDSEEQPKCAALPPQRCQSCLRLTRQGKRHRFSGKGEAQKGNSGLTRSRQEDHNSYITLVK